MKNVYLQLVQLLQFLTLRLLSIYKTASLVKRSLLQNRYMFLKQLYISRNEYLFI